MTAARSIATGFGEDRRWLAAMAVITAVELSWWAIVWRLGFAPGLLPGRYLLFAFAGLAVAVLVRVALRLPLSATRWPAVLIGTLLVALGASAFLPLKYAIPSEIPFWLDAPLTSIERSLFGQDPWRILDHLLGLAAVPLDWLYGAWLPTQAVILFLVMLASPSPAKSRALVAYAAAWFLLGVVAAVLLSSVGPIFYDRLGGGQAFAALDDALRGRGVWIALAESDAMWASLASGHPGLIAGISAAPSIHVAIALWIVLAARAMLPRAMIPALIYFALVWVASVQLGWHYVSDGAIGALGMLGVWRLTSRLGRG